MEDEEARKTDKVVALNGKPLPVGQSPKGLTAKMEAFAREVAQGKPLSEAYRAAYDAARMKPSVIWTEASKMMSRPKVANRVKELLAEEEEKNRFDGDRIRRFVIERLHLEAATAETDGARVKALELLGKLDTVGAFKDRVETEDKSQSAADIEAEIKARFPRLFG